MSRFQIVAMRRGETRYSFVAHGAAYDSIEAGSMIALIERNGGKAIPLPLDTDSTK